MKPLRVPDHDHPRRPVRTCAVCGSDATVLHTGPTTFLPWQPYYDEAEDRHEHDPNEQATTWQCIRGHTWRTTGYRPCRCGWTAQ